MAFNGGVYPVYMLEFKIGKEGAASVPETDLVTIKDLETFSMSIDGVVQDWTPMDTDGWARALMTGKKFVISLNGKRHEGDPGNDYVAETAWADGLDCSTIGQIKFPNGSSLDFKCVIDVKNVEGADSTDVAPLEFDLISDGKPEFTPAV